MSQYTTTITQKGQVTIPSAIRNALGIKPKDKVTFELVNGEVRLRPVKSRLLAGYGAVSPKGQPEDYQKVRREVEEWVGEKVAKES